MRYLGIGTLPKIIKERYQNAGSMNMGWFKPSIPMFREGNDAVDVGRIAKYFSIALFVVILTDILGLHSLTFHFIIADIILYNTVIFFLYPVKSDTTEKPKTKPKN